MKTMTLESMTDDVKRQMMNALSEPVILTASGEPLFVIVNVTDEEIIDDLIARHPDFRASVKLARQQKSQGQVKSLDEIRRKFAGESV